MLALSDSFSKHVPGCVILLAPGRSRRYLAALSCLRTNDASVLFFGLVYPCDTHLFSTGVPELLRTVVREAGFRALYRGVTPSLVGIIPYAGIAFSINEQAKHEVKGNVGC